MRVSERGAAAFARGVARRHGGRGAGGTGPGSTPAPLARVFRREPAPVTLVRRSVQVRLAPTLRLTFAGGGMAASASGAVLPAGAPLVRIVPELDVERTLVHDHTHLVRRLLAREERIVVQTSPAALVHAAIAAARGGTAARPASAPVAAPVERVLRRSPVAPAEERAEGVAADGWGTPIGPRRPAPRPELGGAELDRLTDHVVRTLDRRVAAHRQRHGRG